MIETIESCPCCDGAGLSVVQSASNRSKSMVQCRTCGAAGPTAALDDARQFDVAAVEEWNIWARARRAIRRGEG